MAFPSLCSSAAAVLVPIPGNFFLPLPRLPARLGLCCGRGVKRGHPRGCRCCACCCRACCYCCCCCCCWLLLLSLLLLLHLLLLPVEPSSVLIEMCLFGCGFACCRSTNPPSTVLQPLPSLAYICHCPRPRPLVALGKNNKCERKQEFCAQQTRENPTWTAAHPASHSSLSTSTHPPCPFNLSLWHEHNMAMEYGWTWPAQAEWLHWIEIETELGDGTWQRMSSRRRSCNWSTSESSSWRMRRINKSRSRSQCWPEDAHGGLAAWRIQRCAVDFPLFMAAKALDFLKRLVLHPQTRKVSTQQQQQQQLLQYLRWLLYPGKQILMPGGTVGRSRWKSEGTKLGK